MKPNYLFRLFTLWKYLWQHFLSVHHDCDRYALCPVHVNRIPTRHLNANKGPKCWVVLVLNGRYFGVLKNVWKQCQMVIDTTSADIWGKISDATVIVCQNSLEPSNKLCYVCLSTTWWVCIKGKIEKEDFETYIEITIWILVFLWICILRLPLECLVVCALK